MRSFEECKKIFDMLKPVDFSEGFPEAEVIAFRTKWYSSLSKILYPGYVKDFNDYFLDSQGEIMEGKFPLRNTGDYYSQASLGISYICDYALCYMEKSPFWEVTYESCGMEEEGDEDMPFYLFLKKRFGDFFEKKLYQKPKDMIFAYEHPLYELYGFYENYEIADEMSAIRSSLYPYLEKASRIAGDEFKQHVRYAEEAFGVIEKWLCSMLHCSIKTKRYGYFFCSDDSSSVYNYGDNFGGAHNFCPEVIICAELIEAALFEIHEKIPFLPRRILDMREGGKK